MCLAFSLLLITRKALLEQDHLAGLLEIPGLQTVEVNTGGHLGSVVRASIPLDRLPACRFELIDQGLYQLAAHVVNFQADLHGRRSVTPDIKGNGG